MYLIDLFQTEKYLNHPMVDGESDYLPPGERGAALGTIKGDGNQRRLAYDNDLRATIKKLSVDIMEHGGQMYLDKKIGYYRLEFKDKTVVKFSVGTWNGYSLSMKANLFKNALRKIIVRIENERSWNDSS
jgi:hypothetical protein|tara:strand:- start:29 stop:418 length:390 start_codon:yes stop_codon:yes gene_type:complete